MSRLWLYLSSSFIRLFSLSVCSFVAILLVSRFKEIARFTALSDSMHQNLLFLMYQIPLILPLALPLSALIASSLLFQKLSRSFELTALRASGIGLFSILSPLLLISCLLTICNFALTAKITPFCKRETKSFLYHETTSNPLLLLQRQNLVKTKDCYLKMEGSDEGKLTKNLTLITHNASSNRLSLILAEQLRVKKETLLGKHVTFLSHSKGSEMDLFDPLLIENQKTMSTDASMLAMSLKKKRPHLDTSSLEFPMLRLRAQEPLKRGNKASVEMYRRVSLSFSVFTFTLLGSLFGIELSRVTRKRNLLISSSLSLLLMLSYLFAKEYKPHLPLIAVVLIIPHCLIWLSCLFKFQRITRGIL